MVAASVCPALRHPVMLACMIMHATCMGGPAGLWLVGMHWVGGMCGT